MRESCQGGPGDGVPPGGGRAVPPGQIGGAQVGLARGLALARPLARLRQLEQRPDPARRAGGMRAGEMRAGRGDRVLPVPDRVLVGQPGGRLPGRGHAVLPGWRGGRVRVHEVPGQFGQ